MTEPRLQDGADTRQMRLMRRRRRRLREIEAVLRQRNHQVGIVMCPARLDGTARAELSGGVGAQGGKLELRAY